MFDEFIFIPFGVASKTVTNLSKHSLARVRAFDFSAKWP